jgi:glycosyltransferase involved in cell wall biosynthesis
MVFTGLFTHLPNQQGIRFFLDEVLPLIHEVKPKARLYVVGKNPPAWLQRRADDRVIVTGYVDDVRPYIARAAVFVIPLLSGGGIRGKALEAMAMGKPIVSTQVGIEGIDLVDSRSVRFAESPEAFAQYTLDLLEKPCQAQVMGSAAREAARQNYCWKEKGSDLHRFLSQIGCPLNQRIPSAS